ncbi:hypothetical protein LDENG_00161570 [Lucifuga dentata]|nr:hypothetical protein LDENG_00161570 [Lucifuga dentata]
MHVITQSCVLFLWMHTLTLVKSQDCTLESFLTSSLYDSNFDTTELESSYSAGKQVRVGCNVGFTGFFKLQCIEGRWQSRGTKCQPRSCGHPGDAQFADFHLEKGDDFVFGSEVVYTCNKGYQMVSRKNYRRCMADGWDGLVPVCEAQHCSVIHVDDNVLVTGDPEEATYGNVLRFTCKSSSEILNGPSEIICNENGEWSGEVPKCIEIKCQVPVIENGYPTDVKRVYEQHEILHFGCNVRFTRTEDRPSKCTKSGTKAEFIPAPECEPIKCKLVLPPITGTSYDPPSKSVYFPGQTVRIMCEQQYWVYDHQHTSYVATCQDNGKWNVPSTACEHVVCLDPRDRLVYEWAVYYWQTKKLGDKARYTCIQGYKNKDGVREATCTRNGWMPNPLCEAVTCNRLEVENAEITRNNEDIYMHNEKVRYVCKEGYVGQFILTCWNGGWSGSPVCTELPCKRFEIDNAYITRNDKKAYRYTERVHYACTTDVEKRFTITCGQTGWTGIQSCAGCSKPQIPNGFAVGPYKRKLYYSCNEGFKFFTKGWWKEASCDGSQWSEFVPCIDEKKCGEIPEILNAEVNPISHGYTEGQFIHIHCKEGYHTNLYYMRCQDGKWNLNGKSLEMICTPTANLCKPPLKVKNTIITTPYQKEYLSNSVVTYQCRDQHVMEGEYSIRCKYGTWEMTNLTCTQYCYKPMDGTQTMTFLLDKDRYANGDVLQYQCINESGGNATCVEGTWSQPIKCEEGCKLPLIPGANLLNPALTTRKLQPQGFKITFSCPAGKVIQRKAEVECLANGKWSDPFPTCEAPIPESDADIKSSKEMPP